MSYTNPTPSDSPSPQPQPSTLGGVPSNAPTTPTGIGDISNPGPAPTAPASTNPVYPLTIPSGVSGDPPRKVWVTADQYKKLTGQDPPAALANYGTPATGPVADTSTTDTGTPDQSIQDVINQILNQQQQATPTAKPVDPTITAGEQTYFNIYGVKAPKGYIKGLVNSGLDVFDITRLLLSKPGADNTSYFRDQFAQYAAAAASLFGRR